MIIHLDEPTEPKICRGCEINPYTGEPWTCAQDLEDSRADYEYERRMTPYKLSSGIYEIERAFLHKHIITLMRKERDEIDTPRLYYLYTEDCKNKNAKTITASGISKTLKDMERRGLVTCVKKADETRGAYTKNYWRLVEVIK